MLPLLQVVRVYQCLSAVIGITITPSGRIYAIFVRPQMAQRISGSFDFVSASINLFIAIRSLAALSKNQMRRNRTFSRF